MNRLALVAIALGVVFVAVLVFHRQAEMKVAVNTNPKNSKTVNLRTAGEIEATLGLRSIETVYRAIKRHERARGESHSHPWRQLVDPSKKN